MVHTPLCGDAHPVNSMISTIYSQLSFHKYYPAAIAGLEYNTNVNSRGFQLSVSGYSPKLKKLMVDLCEDWYDQRDSFWKTISHEYFSNLKNRSIQNIKSWYTNRPDVQADTVLSYLFDEHSKLPSEILALTEATTIDNVLERAKYIWNSTQITLYVHGDLNETDTRELYQGLQGNFLNSKTSGKMNDQSFSVTAAAETNGINNYVVPSRSRILSSAGHRRVILSSFNPSDPNSALVTYFQTEVRSPRIAALQLVVSRLLSEPFFSELRTKDQLGYIVSFSQSSYGRYPNTQRGFVLKVLSKKFDPIYCEHRLEEFLKKYYSYINNELTMNNITSISENIIQSLREPPKSYLEEASSFYDVIIHKKPWNITELAIDELRRLTLHDVQDFCNTHLFNKYGTRKSVSVMLFGGVTNENNTGVSGAGEKAYQYILDQRSTSRLSYSDALTNVYGSYDSELSTPLSPAFVALTENNLDKEGFIFGLEEVESLRRKLPFLASTL